MSPFVFHYGPRLVTGEGAAARVGEWIAPGPTPFDTDAQVLAPGLADAVLEALRADGRTVCVYDAVEADPSRATLEAVVVAWREARAANVVGFGSGSRWTSPSLPPTFSARCGRSVCCAAILARSRWTTHACSTRRRCEPRTAACPVPPTRRSRQRRLRPCRQHRLSWLVRYGGEHLAGRGRADGGEARHVERHLRGIFAEAAADADAEGHFTRVCIGRDGRRPVPPPADRRGMLERLI